MESTQRGPQGCWAHCIKVPKWQVSSVPNMYEGTIKNLGLTLIFALFLSVVFGIFCSFHHSVLCMYIKRHAWSAISIINTKRLNFCEQNLQDTDQSTTTLTSVNFRARCCLAKSKIPNLFELHTNDQCYPVATDVVGTHHVVVLAFSISYTTRVDY
jgi:hypothetical protein